MTECPDKKALGLRLRELRKAAGYSNRATFAAEAGLPATVYSEVEQGRTRLSYENAWKIADALGISLDELGGRDWPLASSAAPATSEEGELVALYRACTPEKRSFISTTAQVAAQASGEALCGEEGVPAPVAVAKAV